MCPRALKRWTNLREPLRVKQFLLDGWANMEAKYLACLSEAVPILKTIVLKKCRKQKI